MVLKTTSPKLQLISPGDIRENPENPRLVFRQEEMESLMISIERNGVQVPIAVYREGKHYRLIDGERRWRCAKKLNLSLIPALVQAKPTELQNLLLMYNIHALREQWDYFTIASKLRRIIKLFVREHEYQPNESQLSEATGLSRGQIRRCTLLLDLPERYKKLLLDELRLPKSRQKVTEDLFIEMERALKTVTNRLPEYGENLDAIRDVLIEKFRKGTIPAVTDFRQLSKIATAVQRLGIAQAKARKALDRVFDSKSDEGIREAYHRTVEFMYDERKATQYVASLNSFLQEVIDEGSVSRLDNEFVERLRELEKQLTKLFENAQ